jgi:hypothetical protein
MLTKEEARRFQERWRLVNARTIQEVRDTAPEEKLRQTAVLFEAAHSLGWVDQLAEGEQAVRARWILLKEKLGG